MNKFIFEGLIVERVISHTIFARGKDKEIVPPKTSDDLLPLQQESMDLLQARTTVALGSTSHGIETEIITSEIGSFFEIADKMLDADDSGFVNYSKQLAMNLAKSQTNPKWPGGVLIVMQGTVGECNRRFIGVLKAETDKGFNLKEQNGKTILELVKDMLLTATQKLYKIGVLVEIQQISNEIAREVGHYRAFLFDHLLTSTETANAASYFYNAFLGMGILSSSKYKTRLFFEETKGFINKLNVDDDKKFEFREALRTELRNQSLTINTREFAERNFPQEYRNSYILHMSEVGMPDQAVVKDLDYIKSKLRRPRSYFFSTGVKINAPANADFKDLVAVELYQDGYTTVRIKGQVEKTE